MWLNQGCHIIDPIKERIVDSSNELTSQIIAQYNNIVQEKEEEEESSNKVTRISVFKAITALIPWNYIRSKVLSL